MSWWKSVLGGALGYMLGGPLGAMLGVAFASNFSKRKSSFDGFGKDYRAGDQQRVQAAFLVVYFQLWAILPKSMARYQGLKFS